MPTGEATDIAQDVAPDMAQDVVPAVYETTKEEETDAQTLISWVLDRIREGRAPIMVVHSDDKFLNRVRQKLRAFLSREQFYSILWYICDEDGSNRRPIWTGYQNDRRQQAIH